MWICVHHVLLCASVRATSQQDIRQAADTVRVVMIYAPRLCIYSREKLSWINANMLHMQTHHSFPLQDVFLQS